MVIFQILIHRTLYQSIKISIWITENISALLVNVGSKNNYGAAYLGVPTLVCLPI